MLAEVLRTPCQLNNYLTVVKRDLDSMKLSPLSNVAPWMAPGIAMDSTVGQNAWNWCIETKIEQILKEIANHSEENPN